MHIDFRLCTMDLQRLKCVNQTSGAVLNLGSTPLFNDFDFGAVLYLGLTPLFYDLFF